MYVHKTNDVHLLDVIIYTLPYTKFSQDVWKDSKKMHAYVKADFALKWRKRSNDSNYSNIKVGRCNLVLVYHHEFRQSVL